MGDRLRLRHVAKTLHHGLAMLAQSAPAMIAPRVVAP
jgi:hypothetical protein